MDKILWIKKAKILLDRERYGGTEMIDFQNLESQFSIWKKEKTDEELQNLMNQLEKRNNKFLEVVYNG